MIRDIKNFTEFAVLASKGTVLVDFYGVACGPCRMLAPQLEAFAKEHPDITVIKVEVTTVPALTERFNITSMPTLVLLEDSQEVKRTFGFKRKNELELFVKQQ